MAGLFLLRCRMGADHLLGPRGHHGYGGQCGYGHLPVERVRGAHAWPDRCDVYCISPLPIPVRQALLFKIITTQSMFYRGHVFMREGLVSA